MKFEEWAFFDISSLVKEVNGLNVVFSGGSPKFIAFLKDKCGGYQGALNKKKVWVARNRSYDEYYIECSLFIKLGLEFYSLQKNWFQSWAKQSNLRKLVYLLEFIFERNNLAHNNYTRGRRFTQFTKKSRYLENAVKYAESIHLEFFDWGKQYDNTPNYPVILYFQFGDLQISFHSDIEVDKDFSGIWNGVVNQECPIDMKKILHLMIKYNINETIIQCFVLEKLYEFNEQMLHDKLNQTTKNHQEVKTGPKIITSIENPKIIKTEKRFKTLLNFSLNPG